MKTKAKKANRKTSISKRARATKTVTLRMDQKLAATLKTISTESGTDMQTVCNVLVTMALHFGRKIANESTVQAALNDAVARVMELEGKLMQCRQIMEANDPGNAAMIFGPAVPQSDPQAAEGQPQDAASVAPSAGGT